MVESRQFIALLSTRAPRYRPRATEALPDLCTRSVLLHRRVLASGPTSQVLTPQNLARTFGLADAGAAGPQEGSP